LFGKKIRSTTAALSIWFGNIYIDMKLSNLFEQEDEQVPSDNLPEEETVKNRAYEKINQTIQRWNKRNMFHKEFTIPEGIVRINTIFESKIGIQEGKIELGITFVPNMDPKPVIPTYLLAKSMEVLIDDLKEINPDMYNKPSLYPQEVLNNYEVTIYSVSIFPGEGIIHLSEYIPRATFNMKTKTPIKFGDILFSRSLLLSHYMINENDIPRFDDQYSLAMEKITRRSKTIYTALQKGTFRGLPYQLPKFNPSNVVVHQNRDRFSMDNKVIHPDFSVSISSGWMTLNGEKINEVLPVELQDSFVEYIRNRFKHFDIKFS
jgi:hypothetical protein